MKNVTQEIMNSVRNSMSKIVKRLFSWPDLSCNFRAYELYLALQNKWLYHTNLKCTQLKFVAKLIKISSINFAWLKIFNAKLYSPYYINYSPHHPGICRTIPNLNTIFHRKIAKFHIKIIFHWCIGVFLQHEKA